jgi:muconolactone delta-isomerase
MKILAIERDVAGASADQMHSLLRAEAEEVWALQQADILREIWFTEDHRAVLMLECESVAAAQAALGTLPLYRDGLIDFEVAALRPYDGLERLFG